MYCSSKEYLEDIVATESMEDEELSSRPLDKNYNSIYISQACDSRSCKLLIPEKNHKQHQVKTWNDLSF